MSYTDKDVSEAACAWYFATIAQRKAKAAYAPSDDLQDELKQTVVLCGHEAKVANALHVLISCMEDLES